MELAGIIDGLRHFENIFKYPVHAYADPQHVKLVIFINDDKQPTLTYDTPGFNLTPEFIEKLKQDVNAEIERQDAQTPA